MLERHGLSSSKGFTPFIALLLLLGEMTFLVSASTDPFAAQGAVYRRPIDGNGPLQRVLRRSAWAESG